MLNAEAGNPAHRQPAQTTGSGGPPPPRPPPAQRDGIQSHIPEPPRHPAAGRAKPVLAKSIQPDEGLSTGELKLGLARKIAAVHADDHAGVPSRRRCGGERLCTTEVPGILRRTLSFRRVHLLRSSSPGTPGDLDRN